MIYLNWSQLVQQMKRWPLECRRILTIIEFHSLIMKYGVLRAGFN